MIESDYKNSEMLDIINEYIHNERDRNILKSRYIDGLTFEKIAEKCDISVRQAKRIVYKYEWNIFKYLTSE